MTDDNREKALGAFAKRSAQILYEDAEQLASKSDDRIPVEMWKGLYYSTAANLLLAIGYLSDEGKVRPDIIEKYAMLADEALARAEVLMKPSSTEVIQ